VDFAAGFNPGLSIQENCWNSDGVGLQKIGFYLDGRYQTVFTPQAVAQPHLSGIIYRLTGLDFLDYQITVNVAAAPAKREVDKEEKAIERLRGEYEDTAAIRSSWPWARRKGRSSRSRPDSSGPSRSLTSSVCGTRANRRFRRSARRSRTRSITSAARSITSARWRRPPRQKLSSPPGRLDRCSYRHRASTQRTRIADMPAVPATFTGHLSEAEGDLRWVAKQPGRSAHLFGQSAVRPRHGPPGRDRRGKSMHMRDFLEQTAGCYHYTVISRKGCPTKAT